jgi:hypothetical protein
MKNRVQSPETSALVLVSPDLPQQVLYNFVVSLVAFVSIAAIAVQASLVA